MQVFKLYFKILRRYLGIMGMYIGIFMGVLMGPIMSQVKQNETAAYEQAKSDFAVFDYDNSRLSSTVIQYLETTHNLIVLASDDKETIQDELYAANVSCVVRINKGFEEAFMNDNGTDSLEIFSIPDTVSSLLFKQNLNSYLSTLNTYIKAGFSVTEAGEKALEAANISVSVTISDENTADKNGILHHFFKYLVWIFICLCISSVSPVLTSLDKTGVRNRITSSPYPFIRINLEIVLGVLVTGFAICSICIAEAYIAAPEEISQGNMILYCLNAFCAMATALSLTFLVGKTTDNPQVISLFSNIIGLGMSFLCGVFVPMEFLSDTVIKIAHFLPAYWNIKAIQVIDTWQPEDIGILASYMGIQLLFATAILCVGLVIARRKQTAS